MSSLLSAQVQKLPPCDDPQSPFRTENYQRFAHIPSLFILPFNILGIYCIIYKTSSRMGNFKVHLLTYQIWLLLSDFFLGYLVTPVLFFPVVGGTAVGLLQYFKVPILLQFWLLSVCTTGNTVAIVVLFAYRHQAIVHPNSRLHVKSATVKRVIVGAHYLIGCNSLTIPMFLHPTDQTEALNAASLELKCIVPGFQSGAAAILQAKSQFPFALLADFIFSTIVVSEIAVCVLHSLWHLYKINSHFSKRTMQMQKMYFFQVCIQVIIPLVMLGIPGLGIGWTATSGRYEQGDYRRRQFWWHPVCLVCIHRLSKSV